MFARVPLYYLSTVWSFVIVLSGQFGITTASTRCYRRTPTALSYHPITPLDPNTPLALQNPVCCLRGGRGVERIGAAVEDAVQGVADSRW